jgi:flagellar protein FliJ
MAKFHFKYDSVKKVKDLQEKKIQKEIALIDIEIDKNILECEKLISEIENNMKNRVGSKISQLKAVEDYSKVLKRKTEAVQKRINDLEIQKEKKLLELVSKSKENKIFQALEETYFENYKYEENLKDENIINEIATQKFIRDKS